LKTNFYFQTDNFSYINEITTDNDLTKSDSSQGDGDDETSSNSTHSWQIEDGDDYETTLHKVRQSMKILDK
jgi:hypothetical protein